VQHAAGVPLGAHRQPTALENAEHGAVLGEHIGCELHDTVIPRDLHQVSKQQACDALPLVILFNGKRDLGVAAASEVAAIPDDDLGLSASDRRDERHVAHLIDLGQPAQLLRGELLLHVEHA